MAVISFKDKGILSTEALDTLLINEEDVVGVFNACSIKPGFANCLFSLDNGTYLALKVAFRFHMERLVVVWRSNNNTYHFHKDHESGKYFFTLSNDSLHLDIKNKILDIMRLISLSAEDRHKIEENQALYEAQICKTKEAQIQAENERHHRRSLEEQLRINKADKRRLEEQCRLDNEANQRLRTQAEDTLFREVQAREMQQLALVAENVNVKLNKLIWLVVLLLGLVCILISKDVPFFQNEEAMGNALACQCSL